MQALTTSKAPFDWDSDYDSVFEALKLALSHAPFLRLPDWSQPFHLCADWSKAAVGAVLSQVDPVTKFEHPVAFAGRACTAAEANYSATEGELLVLVWACHKLWPYLHGHYFMCIQIMLLFSGKILHASKILTLSIGLSDSKNSSSLYGRDVRMWVADCLSMSSAPDSQQSRVSHIWPEHYESQKQLDDIPCTAGNDPRGSQKVVICDGVRDAST